MEKRHLLIVDDEPEIGEFIGEIAAEAGFEVDAIDDASRFEAHYGAHTQVVVLDLFMPGRDGIELLRLMAQMQSTAAVVLISGYDKGVLNSARKLATEQGLYVAGTLSKPFSYDEILHLLTDLATMPAHCNSRRGAHQAGLVTEASLREAIENRQLVLHYQPQVDLLTGRLVGVEALVRWRHPEYGLMLPGHFIPMAEKCGLIDALSDEVVSQALRQAGEWKRQGLVINVGINMPPISLKNLSFPEQIRQKIVHNGLVSEQVTLEVTETTLMRELVKSLDILTRIRMKGLSLSIDDFGTGYSSMVQLYRIPFTELKIDLSFVKHATTEPEALAIVRMIIMLGHELGMTLVAEGVEDQATHELLVELGCDRGQGYYYARPMEAEKLPAWAMGRLAPPLGS